MIRAGEVYRRLDRFEASTRDSLKSLDDRLAHSLVGRAEYEARHDALRGRVDDLEEWREDTRAFRRTVVAGMAIAMVSSVGTLVTVIGHLL